MKKLTEAEWRDVFEARCRAKRGIASEADNELCRQAFAEDEKRYSAMSLDVFEATAPFGAILRRQS